MAPDHHTGCGRGRVGAVGHGRRAGAGGPGAAGRGRGGALAGRHRDAPGMRGGGAAVRAPAGESAPAGRRASTGEPGGATAGGGRLRQRPAGARRGGGAGPVRRHDRLVRRAGAGRPAAAGAPAQPGVLHPPADPAVVPAAQRLRRPTIVASGGQARGRAARCGGLPAPGVRRRAGLGALAPRPAAGSAAGSRDSPGPLAPQRRGARAAR